MDFLNNTNIVVALGFLIFVGVLLYYGVPGLLFRQLDSRATKIRADLDEARALREEAQTLLASYERKHKEVTELAADIVKSAKREAEQAAEAAKVDIRESMDRRMVNAGAQIEAAEQGAVRQIRDHAVTVAIAAARDVLSQKLSEEQAASMVDASINEVSAKLH